MRRVQDGDKQAFEELSDQVGGFTPEMIDALKESGVLKELGAEKMAKNLLKDLEKKNKNQKETQIAKKTEPAAPKVKSTDPAMLSSMLKTLDVSSKALLPTNLSSASSSASQTSQPSNGSERKKVSSKTAASKGARKSLSVMKQKKPTVQLASNGASAPAVVGAGFKKSSVNSFDLFSLDAGKKEKVQQNTRSTNSAARTLTSIAKKDTVVHQWGDIFIEQDRKEVKLVRVGPHRYLRIKTPKSLPDGAVRRAVVRVGHSVHLSHGRIARGIVTYVVQEGSRLRAYTGAKGYWPVVNKTPLTRSYQSIQIT